MNSTIKILFITTALFLYSISFSHITTFADTPDEHLIFKNDNTWDPNTIVTKEFPKMVRIMTVLKIKEKYDHFTRILSMTDLAKSASMTNPIRKAYAFQQNSVHSDIKTLKNIEWTVLEESESSMTFSMKAWDNPPFSNRTSIGRILVSENNIWILTYTAKVTPLTITEKTAWLKSLADAKIVHTDELPKPEQKNQ